MRTSYEHKLVSTKGHVIRKGMASASHATFSNPQICPKLERVSMSSSRVSIGGNEYMTYSLCFLKIWTSGELGSQEIRDSSLKMLHWTYETLVHQSVHDVEEESNPHPHTRQKKPTRGRNEREA